MTEFPASRIEWAAQQTASSLCRGCHIRRQQLGGYCRACGRAAGLYDPDIPPSAVRPRGRAAEALRRPLVEAPASLGTVRDRGVYFDVVWNGSIR